MHAGPMHRRKGKGGRGERGWIGKMGCGADRKVQSTRQSHTPAPR